MAANVHHSTPPSAVFLYCKPLDGLMKSGRLGDALDLLDRMPRKNVIAWTMAISGCTRNGHPKAAAAMLADMLESSVAPTDFACNTALAACTAAGASSLSLGEQVHLLAMRAGFTADAWISSCLIDLYSWCGSLREIEDVFRWMEATDVVGICKPAFDVMNLRDAMSWNSLFHGLAQHEDANLVQEAFSEMCSSGW